MYERTSSTGQTVEWNPEHTDAAAQALADVSGTGVSTLSEAKDAAPIDLDGKPDVQQAVRDEYETLTKRVLTIALEDGEMTGDGKDTETVTVHLRDGHDDAVSGTFTVDVDIDGAIKEATVSDGAGSVDVTTDRSAGGTVAVQAVGVDEYADTSQSASRSKKKAIDVV